MLRLEHNRMLLGHTACSYTSSTSAMRRRISTWSSKVECPVM